jgi:hypothetical protein
MSAIIDSIIGWNGTRRRVVAKGTDGELYHGNRVSHVELGLDDVD